MANIENLTLTLSPQSKRKFLTDVFSDEKIVDEIINSSTQDSTSGADSTSSNCLFRPKRTSSNSNSTSDSKNCPNEVTTSFGYCKKHSTTVQANIAKEAIKKYQKQAKAVETKPTKKVSIKEEEHIEDVNQEQKQSKKKSSLKKAEKESPQPKEIPEEEEQPKAKVRMNTHGNYEHEESHIVFDRKTRTAYGVQKKNGDVYSLGPNEVEICIKNGWDYVLPETRCKKKTQSPSSSDEEEDEDDEEEDAEDIDSAEGTDDDDEDDEDLDVVDSEEEED